MKKLIALLFLAIAPTYATTRDIATYGACASSADNDTTAVQNALDATLSNDTLNFSCIASISTSVTLFNRTGVTLKGITGGGLKAIGVGGTGPANLTGPYQLYVSNCTNCFIQDMEFDSNDLRMGGLGIGASTGTTISGNYLHDVKGNVTGGAMAGTGTTNLIVRGNRIERTSKYLDNNEPRGMWFGNTSTIETNILVENNVVIDAAGTGIVVNSVGYTVRGNTVTRSTGACMKMAVANAALTQVIENNTFESCNFNAIQLMDQNNHTVENLIIRDNTMRDNGNLGVEGGKGIASFTRLKNAQIIRNKIYNTNLRGLNGWSCSGIYLQGADNLTIADNEIYDDGQDPPAGKAYNGIYIEARQTSQNVTISGNRFHGHTFTGVLISDPPSPVTSLTGVSITGNVFTSNSIAGVKIEENNANMLGSISQSGNCWNGNATNIMDDRGGRALANPGNDASCSWPLAGGDAQDPTVPTNLQGTATSSSSVGLTWTASTDNVAVTGYRVYRGGASIGTTSQLSFTDSGLAPSTQYTYTVLAYDAAGNESAQTAGVNVTTQAGSGDTTAPTVPTNLQGTGTSTTRIDLTWNVSTDNVGVAGYRIFRGGVQIGTSTGAAYYDTPLTPGTQYTYTVLAYDAANNASAQTAGVNVSTQSEGGDTQDPSIPQALQGSATSTTRVDLHWNLSTDNVGVIGYKIYQDGVYCCTSPTAYGGNYYITPLTPGQTYSFYVTAYDQAGNESDPSSTIQVTLPSGTDVTAPSVPTGLAVVGLYTTRTDISWTASTDNVAVTGYWVYKNGVQVGTTASTSYSFTGLTPGTQYTYTVAAYDAASNQSAQSTGLVATTSGNMAVAVQGVTNTQAILSYTAPSGSNCTVKVSEFPSLSPVVHDVNPLLYANANVDLLRDSTIARGYTRYVVVGRRKIAKALDKHNYSLSLQAATQHYFQVDCGGTTGSGSFTTATVALGNTHTDGYQVDPERPGETMKISMRYTPEETWTDPHTGVLLRLMARPGEAPADNATNHRFASVVSATDWADTANAIGTTGGIYSTYSGASCTGAECDWMLLQAADITTAKYWYDSLRKVTFNITGFGSEATAADRTIEVCLVPNSAWLTAGTVCDTDPSAVKKEIILPQSTESAVATTSGSGRLDMWRETPGYGPGMLDFKVGTVVQLRLALRKKTATGSISIRNANLNITYSGNSYGGTGGNFERCNTLIRPDGRQLCTSYWLAGTVAFYLVDSNTGASTFVGKLYTNDGTGTLRCAQDHFMGSLTDPNQFFCQTTDAGINRLKEVTYTGPGTTRADGYLWALNTDFTLRTLAADLRGTVQSFYDAHAGEWHGMLGGAGNYVPFNATHFPTCAAFTNSTTHVTGWCLSAGAQDAPAWLWAMRISDGAVTALMPMYASAASRWGAGHSFDIPGGPSIIMSTNTPVSHRSTLNGTINNLVTSLALTSSCSGNCTGWADGHPTTATAPANFLMRWTVGDCLKIDSEYMRITSIAGTTYGVTRAISGSAASHTDGASVVPVRCTLPSVTQGLTPYIGTQAAHLLWRFTEDPYGTATDGSTVWANTYWGHMTTRGHRAVNVLKVGTTTPGQSILYNVRDFPYNYLLYGPQGFAGKAGTSVGAYQMHASWNNSAQQGFEAEWYTDFGPMVGGTLTSQAATLVGGTTSVYKYFPLTALSPKHWDIFGSSGSAALRDVSGPTSAISDATPFVTCHAYAAGECVAGSAAGDTYAVSTRNTTNTCGSASMESYVYSAVPSDLCVLNMDLRNQAVWQASYLLNDKSGMAGATGVTAVQQGAKNMRLLLRSGLAGFARANDWYQAARALSNGKWLQTANVNQHEGSQIVLAKLPPVSYDSVNRATFIPVPVKIGSVPSGTDNVIVEFGYSDRWDPSDHRCTSRAESCVAHSATITEANPFSYATVDAPYTGVSCASGCTVVIPAYSGRVVYPQVVYRDASNNVIRRVAQPPVAVP
jgi:chitodextrinase